MVDTLPAVAPTVRSDRGLQPPLSAGRRSHAWWTTYAYRLLITDAVAVYIAVFTAYVVRFDGDGTARVSGQLSPSYLLVSIVLMWAWLLALVVGRTHDRRLAGAGASEYQRAVDVSWRMFATVAIIAYLLRMEVARGYLAIAFPLGLGLLLLGRFLWRRWLHQQRRAGAMQSRVLVVGHPANARALIQQLASSPTAGFGVVGVCVPHGSDSGRDAVPGAPVLGTFQAVAEVARTVGAEVVAVSGSDVMTADAVRQLGWDLEGTGIDLVLAPSLTDVAGPRVLMQPVSGLPLLYVTEPRFSGARYALKASFDWLAAAVITVALMPALFVIGLAVKTTSPGPVFYRQERIGLRGLPFHMVKFRSMEIGAEHRLDEVMGEAEVGLFYKRKDDPRVTRLGRVLRRYSLDELPQLFNVLAGQMSLVGPRPQIAREVELYDRKAHRRLLVKPGLTGLWQVSGRSELSPDEGIRMDVYYVENWSLVGDLVILARTAQAMIRGEGAY